MAAFHEVQFPTDISIGAAGGPGFKTTVLTLSSGFERRNIDWSVARAMYDVGMAVKTQTQLNVLLKFFYARRAKAYGFRFKDWTDYRLPFTGDALPLLFTTNGSLATFQLVKVYGDAGNSYTRTITKPVAGTVELLDNGTPTVDFTVSTTTGIVTLGNTTKSTTGHLITGGCQFDVPVRFDIDEMKASVEHYNLFTWSQIPIVEVRI